MYVAVHGLVFGITLYTVLLAAYVIVPERGERFLVSVGTPRFFFFRMFAIGKLYAVVFFTFLYLPLLYLPGTSSAYESISYVATAVVAAAFAITMTFIERTLSYLGETRESRTDFHWTDLACVAAYFAPIVLIPAFPFFAKWLTANSPL